MTFIIKLALIFQIYIFHCSRVVTGNKTVELTILDHILSNDLYNVHQRPVIAGENSATRVYLLNLIKNMLNFDDVEQEISLQITLRTVWVDERLRYDKLFNVSDLPRHITINDVSRVWYPDIFVSNAKKNVINSIIKPNILFRIYPNGTLSLSILITFTATCQMDLHWYPFEKHECPINFASYSLTKEELILKWNSYYPVQINKAGLQLNRIKFDGYYLDYGTFSTALGDFSWANMVLKFRREISFYFYIFNIYSPCMLFVVISWISFWFDVTSRDARVGLGITTILTLGTQIYSFNQSAPRMAYIKAVDIYTSICQLLVCFALLEFATVDFASRYFAVPKPNSVILRTFKIFTHPDLEKSIMEDEKFEQGKILARKIDMISRFLFPSVFVVFNIIYLTVCIFYANK